MKNRIILDEEKLYDLYCNKMLNQKDVADHFGCSIDTVRRNLKVYNIQSHTPNYHTHKQKVFLNSEQKDYLYGAMLGDGCLSKSKRGINSQFIYTSKSYQHVKFVSIPFKDVLYKEGIKYTTYNDKRTGKEYSRYVFRTITDAGFENERKIWYPDGYKHIPNNLKLNPTICLIWYLGDGGICNNKSSQNIKLSTQCFDKEEQEDILIPQLSHYDAALMKADKGKNGKSQYYIYIPHRKITNFLEYIGGCPFEDYAYKWSFKEYKNKVPEQQTKNEKYFIKLYLLGLTCQQIADVFDVNFNTVKKYLIKNNLYERR